MSDTTPNDVIDESVSDTTTGSNYQDVFDSSSVVTPLANTTAVELSLDETPKSEDLANNSSKTGDSLFLLVRDSESLNSDLFFRLC